jgi:hypothetical protein
MPHQYDHGNSYRLLTTPQEVEQVLKNETNPPYSMADEYRRISKRFQIDFSASIALLERLPVFLAGEDHKHFRRKMATTMARLKSAQELAIKSYVLHLDNILVSDKVIDLKNDFIRPLWRHFANVDQSFSSGDLDLIEEIPYLFNKNSSIKKRIEINQRLTHYLSSAAIDDEAVLDRLGHYILGYTPLIESLTISLFEIFKQNKGRALSQIKFPREILASAVPRTDRWVGDRLVGCPLHSPHYSQTVNQEYMFGIGPHVCLGGPISRFIWPLITARLARSPLVIDDVNLDFLNSSSISRASNDKQPQLMDDPFIRTLNFKLILKKGIF